MQSVVFARTRHHYDPYTDFFRLVNLAGFNETYIDTINWQAPITVIASPHNGEYVNIPHVKRARLIWWNLERCREVDSMSTAYVPPYVNEVWASDKAMADRYGFRYVFLGGHRAFGDFHVTNKRYDYVTLMANFGRRMALFNALKGLSNGDVPLGGTWNTDRHERLQQSSIMISCHQDELLWSEPLRFMIAACYGIPLLSETCKDAGYYRPNEHYVQCDMADLPNMAKLLLHPVNELTRRRLAANAWRLVCSERTFKDSVQEALKDR